MEAHFSAQRGERLRRGYVLDEGRCGREDPRPSRRARGKQAVDTKDDDLLRDPHNDLLQRPVQQPRQALGPTATVTFSLSVVSEVKLSDELVRLISEAWHEGRTERGGE